MAKAKKAKTVPTETAAQARAALTEPAPAEQAAEFFRLGCGFVEEAHKKLDSAAVHLNDARAFWDTLDPVERAPRLKAIQDFFTKAQFALSSLGDELKIVAKTPKADGRPIAKLELPAEAPTAPAADAAPEPIQHLELLKRHFSVAVVSIGQREMPVQDSQPFHQAGAFFADQLKAVKMKIVAAGGDVG